MSTVVWPDNLHGTLALGIDPDGNAETVTYTFDYTKHPAIVAGDTIVASPAPAFAQGAPSGQPTLTVSVISTAAKTVTVTITLTGGAANQSYLLICTATTAGRDRITFYLSVSTVGHDSMAATGVTSGTYGGFGSTVSFTTDDAGSITAAATLAMGVPTYSPSLPPAGTAGRIARKGFDNLGYVVDTGTQWSDVKFHYFYLQDFYKPGDTDDTGAFQDMLDAMMLSANVCVGIIPDYTASPFSGNGQFTISSTITIQQGGSHKQTPSSWSFIFLRGAGRGSTINYTGEAGTPLFLINSCDRFEWHNLKIVLASSQCIAFDCRIVDGYAVSEGLYHNIEINLGSGYNNIGWRLGWDGATNGNFASITFNKCFVEGNGYQYGGVAVQVCGANAYPIYYIDFYAYHIYSMVYSGPLMCILSQNVNSGSSTIDVYNSFLLPPTGECQIGGNHGDVISYTGNTQAANGQLTGVTGLTRSYNAGSSVAQYLNIQDNVWGVVPGADHQFIWGGAASWLGETFVFLQPGSYSIRDFDNESGSNPTRFLRVGDATLAYASTEFYNVTVTGGRIIGDTLPPDGLGVVRLAGNVTVAFQGVDIWFGNKLAQYTSTYPFCSQVVSGAQSVVSFEDGYLQAALPFNNLQNAVPFINRCTLLGSSGQITSFIPETSSNFAVSLTDGNTVTIDLSLSDTFELPFNNSYDGNRTVRLANASYRQSFILKTQQTASGGSTVTSWDASTWGTIRGPGGWPPTFTTTASKGDRILFEKDAATPPAWWATWWLAY